MTSTCDNKLLATHSISLDLNMISAFKDFANSSAMKLAMAVTVSFGAAANANSDVAYGCRKPEAVPALQQQVQKEEGMIPVAARFTALSETEFVQETIMMNPNSKAGLRWSKANDGTVCILTKYEDIQLFNNQSFNDKSFLKVAGKDDNTVEINQAITRLAFKSSQNPMYRAVATSPTNAHKNDPVNFPTRYVEYMLGNPETQKGAVLAAKFDGQRLKSYTKDIPNPSEAPVKFGATFSKSGWDIINGQK